jgi:hypothetical protein
MYADSQDIEKPYNSNIFGSNITKGLKQNNQNLLRLSMPNNAKGAAHFGSM